MEYDREAISAKLNKLGGFVEGFSDCDLHLTTELITDVTLARAKLEEIILVLEEKYHKVRDILITIYFRVCLQTLFYTTTK